MGNLHENVLPEFCTTVVCISVQISNNRMIQIQNSNINYQVGKPRRSEDTWVDVMMYSLHRATNNKDNIMLLSLYIMIVI